MKNLCIICLFTCVQTSVWAQVNFVKNPSFEEYSKCPDQYDQITFSKYWSNIIDTVFNTAGLQSEYYNTCAISNIYTSIPVNGNFYQYAKSGNAMSGACFYFDKSSSVVPPTPNYREYLQGRFQAKLISGKTYCVTFYVNLMEASGYGHNNIGAYIDDGSINTIGVPVGSEVTTLIPQVYTTDVISDTMNWVKIEGSFTAFGNESHFSIGNFSANSATTTLATNYWHVNPNYSYYLIDDVSVIPIDLDANAGLDTWVELGKQVQIGRVGDTTAMGLDCKWYHKGILIDSGAIISVNASSIKNAIDTYVVVQTICGNVKTDTVLVKTTGLGIKENSAANTFGIYPNPSSGTITITSLRDKHSLRPQVKQSEAKVYDLIGRVVYQQNLSFSNQSATIKLNIPNGSYILELQDQKGNVQRERILIE